MDKVFNASRRARGKQDDKEYQEICTIAAVFEATWKRVPTKEVEAPYSSTGVKISLWIRWNVFDG